MTALHTHTHTSSIGQCKQFTVGESMTSCKSMDGWREAGHSQCALRGAEEGQTHLMHMEVHMTIPDNNTHSCNILCFDVRCCMPVTRRKGSKPLSCKQASHAALQTSAQVVCVCVCVCVHNYSCSHSLFSAAKPITERPTQAHSSGPPTKPAQPTKPDMHVAVYEQVI